MKCPKCKSDGVENTVMGKSFYYCRTCKDEIVKENPSLTLNKDEDLWDEEGHLSQKEIDDLFALLSKGIP